MKLLSIHHPFHINYFYHSLYPFLFLSYQLDLSKSPLVSNVFSFFPTYEGLGSYIIPISLSGIPCIFKFLTTPGVKPLDFSILGPLFFLSCVSKYLPNRRNSSPVGHTLHSLTLKLSLDERL